MYYLHPLYAYIFLLPSVRNFFFSFNSNFCLSCLYPSINLADQELKTSRILLLWNFAIEVAGTSRHTNMAIRASRLPVVQGVGARGDSSFIHSESACIYLSSWRMGQFERGLEISGRPARALRRLVCIEKCRRRCSWGRAKYNPQHEQNTKEQTLHVAQSWSAPVIDHHRNLWNGPEHNLGL